MTHSTAEAVGTAALPATLPVSGKLGMWLFLASEVVLFGGLIASYVVMRLARPGWAVESAHLSLVFGAVNTAVLLTSSFSIVMAHRAVDAERGAWAARWLTLTVVLGLVFLCIKGIEWRGELGAGFTPSAGGFWSFYYTMTGLHALHVTAGIIINGILLILAAAGRLAPVGRRVEFAGLYWHFVDIVWIFLFPLIYLT